MTRNNFLTQFVLEFPAIYKKYPTWEFLAQKESMHGASVICLRWLSYSKVLIWLHLGVGESKPDRHAETK